MQTTHTHKYELMYKACRCLLEFEKNRQRTHTRAVRERERGGGGLQTDRETDRQIDTDRETERVRELLAVAHKHTDTHIPDTPPPNTHAYSLTHARTFTHSLSVCLSV